MLFLICAIVSSSLINIVMRLSQGRIRGRYSVLAANYVTCAVLACCFTGVGNLLPVGQGIGPTLGLGTVNGVFYLATLVLTQYNIKRNGVVLSSVFSRIGSLLVPMIAAIVCFGERPGAAQLLGATIAMGAIVIMNYDRKQGSAQALLPLLLLLMSDGMSSTMSKIYNMLGSGVFMSQFLLYTFATACVLCSVLVVVKKERPGFWEALFGIGIGIPNYFASRFLLRALETVPAVIAYPIRSVGTIVVIAMAGLFLFRERLRKNQWIAVGAILAAVVLLSM